MIASVVVYVAGVRLVEALKGFVRLWVGRGLRGMVSFRVRLWWGASVAG
jgi:hypothetical protein